jgi:hypothetical protein
MTALSTAMCRVDGSGTLAQVVAHSQVSPLRRIQILGSALDGSKPISLMQLAKRSDNKQGSSVIPSRPTSGHNWELFEPNLVHR